MGILEGIIGPLLQKYLGAYFEGLDNLDISLFSSETTLTNLKLKTSALDELELPIAVQHGLLERLYLKIPILSLGSEPVIVQLRGLHVVAGPKHRESASDAEERERLERTKKRRLQLADLLGLDEPDEVVDEATKLKRRKKAEEENDSVLGKLKMKILNNIQVKVENIHLRYQDDLSNPEMPFALGVTLDELYAESADEGWKPGWIKSSKSTIIRKLARLQNLCIYFDTAKSATAPPQATTQPTAPITSSKTSTTTPTNKTTGAAPSAIAGPVNPMLKLPATRGPPPSQLPQAEIGKRDLAHIIFRFPNDQQMCKALTELTYKASRHLAQPQHDYVLSPFSAQIKFTLDISEDMANFSRPKVQMDARVEDIQLAINQAQFFGALDLFQYFSLYINSLKYLSLRPAQLNDKTLQLPENRSKLARIRWSYVIACVRSDIRTEADSWSWSNIVQRKKDRILYTDIFKRMKSDKKLKPIEEEQLMILEKRLDYDDIIVYRKLAYASILRDKRRKRKKRPDEKDTKSTPTSTPRLESSSPKVKPREKEKDAPKEKEKGKEKEKEKKKEKEKEEGTVLERLFGLKKSDAEKARDKERAREKKQAEKAEKERKEAKARATLGPTHGSSPANTSATPPASKPPSGASSAPAIDSLDDVDEEELLKELYESIGFDATQVKEHSDYPKDYIHTKLSFHILQGRINLAEVDRKMPLIGTFSFANVFTGVKLSGLSSVNLEGYVETCEMFEYHTLGGPDKPFPVIQRDLHYGPAAPQILSFTVGIDAPASTQPNNEHVDLELSVLALPLLITISRPFIDRLLVFFDLYGRDDITEHLSEIAQRSFESIKQKAEAQVKYALGARSTLLVDAIVHAPRIQVPSDYRDPLSSLILMDLGIISVVADTTARPDSKAALAKVQAARERYSANTSTLAPSDAPASSQISEDYFYDRIIMKLTGITAGVVGRRKDGEPRRPPPKDSVLITPLLHKVDTTVQLSICNTPTPDLSRVRVDATVSTLKLYSTKQILAIVFDVVKTASRDTRPRDPVREAILAEKARLRRLQLILWSEELGDDAPALHALLQGMGAVNRQRQNLTAFLDFDESETETEATDTETDMSESEDPSDMSISGTRTPRSISSSASSSSVASLAQVKERLRHPKARPAKQRLELKLFEAHFKLDGISVTLAETLQSVDYDIVTLQLVRVMAQLNMTDQSIVLNTSLQAFAIQEHITERTSFGTDKGQQYIIRSLSPPELALIHIHYEQLDRRCVRYADVDHNVKVVMQGLEITVSRLTIASLIVVSTEITTALQQAMGVDVQPTTIDLSKASSLTPRRMITDAGGSDDNQAGSSDSESVDESSSEDAEALDRRAQEMVIREAAKSAQQAMAKAKAQEGICLAAVELSLKEVVVQLTKEGTPFFKLSISDAHSKVGIFPDHTTTVKGSLSDLRCSARTNESGQPLWSLDRAIKPTSTAPLVPNSWHDIIYVEGGPFGVFSLKIFDPRMPNFPGHDMEVEAAVGGLRVVVLFRIIDEIITYLTAFTSMLGVIGYLQAAKSTDEPEPKTKLSVKVSSPTIFIPRATDSREFISITLGETYVRNRLDTIAGIKYDFMTVTMSGLNLKAMVINQDNQQLVDRYMLDTLDLSLNVNRAIEGNKEHILPDVDISSTIDLISISIAAADLSLLVGLLAGNFSEFVLRKDEVELKEAIAFLEKINLVQFISNLVPLSMVMNVNTIPFVKVNCSFNIGGIRGTLYQGAAQARDGVDSGILSASVTGLDMSVIVTSDDGVQLSLNVERIEVLDCSQKSPNKFRYVLLPNLGFATAHSSLTSSTSSAPGSGTATPQSSNRLSTSFSGAAAGTATPQSSNRLSTSFSGAAAAGSPLVRSNSGLPKPPPFFKMRYEDRPKESIEFVTVALLNPRIFIVPSVAEELVSLLFPIIASLLTALDTWHQRLIFGSVSEQKDVLMRAIADLESRHRDELAQMVVQHRNQLSSIRLNKNSTAADEDAMMKHQEIDRNALLIRQKQQQHDLKTNGIVPKWTNPNEMRVKVEIESPELCIVERSDITSTPSFVISLAHVLMRVSILPEKITIEPNISEFGVFKAMLDTRDIVGTLDKILLLQPFDLHANIIVKPPTVSNPGQIVDILFHIGLIHTIISYRDVRLGVEVYRSFEPMIAKIVKLVEEVTAASEDAAKLRELNKPQEDLVLQFNVKQMLFSLLNDHNPQFVVPVAKVMLANIVALVQVNDSLNVTVSLPSIVADGFNNALSSYEPLMEPWGLDLKVLERGSLTTIPITAEQRPLNVNVTKSLLDAIFGIIAFVDDMKAILFPGENLRILKAGAAAAAQTSTTPLSSRLHRQSSPISQTGIIPSTMNSPALRQKNASPSASLNIHKLATLGEAPAIASPSSSAPSPSTTPASDALAAAAALAAKTSSHAGAERSFDPFLVRNDTNQHIRVWKSSDNADSGFTLEPGEQMSLRSQKASKHAADTTFFINAEINIGTSVLALERIPIEKVHTQVYSMQGDRNVRILSEVTLQQGTKILTLSTVHYIRNLTTETIEALVVAHPGVHEMHIPPQQTRSIPISFCNYKEIRMRPQGGFQWYSRLDKIAETTMNCNSEDPNSSRSWSCCLSYTSRVIEGGKDYCITLSPQLILENLLCSQLLVKTYTPQIKVFNARTAITSFLTGTKAKADTMDMMITDEAELPTREIAFDIEVGDQLPIFAAQAAISVIDQSLRIQMPGYQWSDPINMRELFQKQRPGSSFERAISMQDVSGRHITITALIYPPSLGSMRVSFFSRYWLINQTGLCLSFRANSKAKPLLDDPRSINMTGNPRTWYKGDFMSERAAQKTFYSIGEISMQVVATGADQNSPWSNTYTLEQREEDQVQQTKLEKVEITDPKTNRMYTFTMEITTAPGKHWRTKEVRITPTYMLINKTNLTLYYDQFRGSSSSSKMNGHTCFDLLPGERVPFHWPNAKISKRRFIFTTKEAYTASKDPMLACWSCPFKLTVLDSFVFKIRTGASGTSLPAGQDQLILVQIIERKNVNCIVFRNAPQDTIPFYKIDNRTTSDIFVEQEGVKGSRERVPPKSLQPWYWEDPLMDPSSRNIVLFITDPSGSRSLSDGYKVNLDRSIAPRDEREAREGRPTMDLPNWDAKFPGVGASRFRVRLMQQGFAKILRIEAPSRGAVAAGKRPTLVTSSDPVAPTADDGLDMFTPEGKRIVVELRLSGIGISLVDHFRAKVPAELVYVTLGGITMDMESCKDVHTVTLNVKKFQVDNQMKFAPEPVLLTSVRAPLRGAKRTSDIAPFLMTTIEIDTSEPNLVYLRQMALEMQVLDVAVDQPFILAMAGFGEGLARYIAIQSGQEQSVLSMESTLPTIEDTELVSPNFFVQGLKIYPVKLVLSLTKGGRSEPVSSTSNSETLIKRITDPILAIGSINRTTVQLGAFEMTRVNASLADLGVRFGEHYKGEGFLNITKVLFNYLSIIKIFSSDPPPRAPVRLPRYFPPDHLVIPYDTAKAYGQNLLVRLLHGKYASETYLFHVWLGGATKPTLMIVSTTRILLIDTTSGLLWEEKTESFIDIQISRPNDTRAKEQIGMALFFFDKFDTVNADPADHKRTISGLPVEQLLALDKHFQLISKARRSTSHTVNALPTRMSSLSSNY